VRDWNAVELRIRQRATLSFEAPRVLATTTPDEYRRIAAEGGLLLRLMLAVLVPHIGRRERRVFGADYPGQGSR
jgi:hypothetical protein